MSELNLKQSVNLNIIFMVTSIVGFFYNNQDGRNAMLFTILFLLLFIPAMSIIKNRRDTI